MNKIKKSCLVITLFSLLTLAIFIGAKIWQEKQKQKQAFEVAFSGRQHFGVNLIYQGLPNYSRQKGGTPSQYAKEFIDLEDHKLADIGVGWIRSAGEGDLTSFAWKKVEPQEDQFDFALTDIRVKEAQAYGLNSLGIFEIQPDYQGHVGAIPDYGKSKGFYFNEEKYLTYLNKVVKRYDGDGKDDMPGLTKAIKYWEVGNEIELPQMFSGTAQDYAHVLQISYQGVKANCADCQVLIGGWVTGVNSEQQFQKSLDYLEAVLKTAGKYFDIMNFHQYADGGDFMTYAHISGFKNLFAKYNLTKPFWITESNTKLHKERASGNLVEHTLAEQSQDIVKRFVIAFDAGVDVFFWHGLDDTANGPGVGIFDENSNPKPIYYNLKYLINKIGNFNAVKKIDLGDPNLYLYQFTVNNKSVFILWTLRNEFDLDLSRYLGQSAVILTKAMTQMGQSQPEVKTVSSKQIPLDQTPVFLNSN